MTLKDKESFFFCFAISLHAEIVFARISIGREVDIELTYYFVLEQRDTRRDRIPGSKPQYLVRLNRSLFTFSLHFFVLQ